MRQRDTPGADGSAVACSIAVLMALLVTSACSRAGTSPALAHAEREASVDGATSSRPKVNVLVTGFHDWRDLGQPPDLWRCRDNPSCRLLLGEPTAGREPVEADFDGPLVKALRARAAVDVTYHFDTMPVTWGAYDTLGDVSRFDVVVHLGLGVYDTTNAIQVEHGAFNLRRGTDAEGVAREEPVNVARPERIDGNDQVELRIAALTGRRHGAYVTRVGEARPGNSYLCNETHFRALETLASDVGGPEAAYFVHIPAAMPSDPTHEALAEGVAGVIRALAE